MEACNRLGVARGDLDFLEKNDVGPFPAQEIGPEGRLGRRRLGI